MGTRVALSGRQCLHHQKMQHPTAATALGQCRNRPRGVVHSPPMHETSQDIVRMRCLRKVGGARRRLHRRCHLFCMAAYNAGVSTQDYHGSWRAQCVGVC